jgi:hypothetical protein
MEIDGSGVIFSAVALLTLSNSVSVHGHALRASAHFPFSSRAYGSAALAAVTAALLQGKKLFGTEGFVVDLRRCLNEILEVGSEKEVAEIDEFAVILVLDVDDTPSVLAAPNLLAINNDGLLRSDNGEWDEILRNSLAWMVKTHWQLPRTLICALTARSSSSNSSLS